MNKRETRLKNLFSQDVGSSPASGADIFAYKPRKSLRMPKTLDKSRSASPSPSGTSVLVALGCFLYRYDSNQRAHHIGQRAVCVVYSATSARASYALVGYEAASKRRDFAVALTEKFKLNIQPGFFAGFRDSSGTYWSLKFQNSEDLENLATTVALACASQLHYQKKIVLQDIGVPSETSGKPIRESDCCSIQYLIKIISDGNPPKTGNVVDRSESPTDVVVGKDCAIPGVSECLLGLKFGAKRLAVVPHELCAEWKATKMIAGHGSLLVQVHLLPPLKPISPKVPAVKPILSETQIAVPSPRSSEIMPEDMSKVTVGKSLSVPAASSVPAILSSPAVSTVPSASSVSVTSTTSEASAATAASIVPASGSTSAVSYAPAVSSTPAVSTVPAASITPVVSTTLAESTIPAAPIATAESSVSAPYDIQSDSIDETESEVKTPLDDTENLVAELENEKQPDAHSSPHRPPSCITGGIALLGLTKETIESAENVGSETSDGRETQISSNAESKTSTVTEVTEHRRMSASSISLDTSSARSEQKPFSQAGSDFNTPRRSQPHRMSNISGTVLMQSPENYVAQYPLSSMVYSPDIIRQQERTRYQEEVLELREKITSMRQQHLEDINRSQEKQRLLSEQNDVYVKGKRDLLDEVYALKRQLKDSEADLARLEKRLREQEDDAQTKLDSVKQQFRARFQQVLADRIEQAIEAQSAEHEKRISTLNKNIESLHEQVASADEYDRGKRDGFESARDHFSQIAEESRSKVLEERQASELIQKELESKFHERANHMRESFDRSLEEKVGSMMNDLYSSIISKLDPGCSYHSEQVSTLTSDCIKSFRKQITSSHHTQDTQPAASSPFTSPDYLSPPSDDGAFLSESDGEWFEADSVETMGFRVVAQSADVPESNINDAVSESRDISDEKAS
eukprot:1012744_1